MNLEKAEAAIRDLLTVLDVPDDEGGHLDETPRRVAHHWAEALAGYREDPAEHLERIFVAPGEYCGPVIVSGLRLVSTCAHHLLPITGTATVAYRPRPGMPITGLSKLARVLEGYSRRLQVQERIGHQVVAAIMDQLSPYGAGCVITAEHGCMTVRGISQHQAVTTTYAWGGNWNTPHPEAQSVLADHRESLRQ